MSGQSNAQGIDMTKGKPMSCLIRFSTPLLIGNLLQQVYNMVDSSVAGTFIGMNALSAVSNGYLVVMMITTLFSGLSIGGTVLVAQFYGNKDEEGVGKTVDAIYFGISVLFAPLMIIGWFASAPLLSLFQVPDEIFVDAVTYVRVIFLGVLGGMGYNINAGILNGLGDSKTSLKFLAISCVGNAILDVLFVAVFGMGVFGTALATILAQFASWLLGVRYMNRKYSSIHIGLPRKDVDFTLMKQALKVGIPASIGGLQYTVGMMLIQSLVNSYGTNFIAGVNAAMKIDAFNFMIINSFCSAMSAYTAQNIGAGNLQRVKEGVRAGMLLTCVVNIALEAVFLPTAGWLMTTLFGLTTEALAAAMAYLYRVMLPSFILGISYIISGTLQGAGATSITTATGIFAFWIVRIPLAHWMAANWGRDNMFCAYLVAWCISILLNGSYYLSGRWKKIRVLTGGQNNEKS